MKTLLNVSFEKQKSLFHRRSLLRNLPLTSNWLGLCHMLMLNQSLAKRNKTTKKGLDQSSFTPGMVQDLFSEYKDIGE